MANYALVRESTMTAEMSEETVDIVVGHPEARNCMATCFHEHARAEWRAASGDGCGQAPARHREGLTGLQRSHSLRSWHCFRARVHVGPVQPPPASLSSFTQVIKDAMDRKFGPMGAWHVITGQSFSYDVTHEVRHGM